MTINELLDWLDGNGLCTTNDGLLDAALKAVNLDGDKEIGGRQPDGQAIRDVAAYAEADEDADTGPTISEVVMGDDGPLCEIRVTPRHKA